MWSATATGAPSSSRRTFRAPRLIWNAARQTQAAGSPTAAPRRSSLRVGLGDRVAGDLRVAGEGVDRTPEPIGIGPVEGLDVVLCVDHGQSGVHFP